MSWKVPSKVQKQTWSVIERDGMCIVVPSVDSQAHNLDGLTCPCNPRTEIEGEFLTVIHDAFDDKDRIHASLSSLGL